MLVIIHLLASLLWSFISLLEATPTPTPIPVTVVSPKSFWPETFTEWAGITSAVAIILGGIWAVHTYRRGQRLKAAETLLGMEQEFRVIIPTYELIENPGVYPTKVKPIVQAALQGATLSDDQVKTLAELDRCLRFLFLCSVLSKDLAVEQHALIRAYCYYVSLLAKVTDKSVQNNVWEDLSRYLNEFYPRLCKWIDEYRQPLLVYRGGGLWKPKPRWKFWA